MGRKKIYFDKPKTVRVRKTKEVSGVFSEHYEKYVKPHIKSDETKKYIDIVMDYEKLNALTRKELIEATQNIQTLANLRISKYLGSNYYKMTKEGQAEQPIPTPQAYKLLTETKGEISKFSMEDIKEMSVNQLRKRLVVATQFVTSESSILGNKYFGQKRILKQRQEMFTAGIFEGMDASEVYNWRRKYDKYVKSEEFSKMFWQVFAKLEELTKFQSFRYSKEYIGKVITQNIIKRRFFEYDRDSYKEGLESGEIASDFAVDLKNIIDRHIKSERDRDEDTVQEGSPTSIYRNKHKGDNL